MAVASRLEVFEAINSERVYQKKRWGLRYETSEGDEFRELDKTVGEFLVYMQDYLTEAFHDASRNDGEEKTLESLRKVVTLGVACLEQHGVKKRPDSPVINGRDGRVTT